eukprot:6939859-Prymnesium_polylepis.1
MALPRRAQGQLKPERGLAEAEKLVGGLGPCGWIRERSWARLHGCRHQAPNLVLRRRGALLLGEHVQLLRSVRAKRGKG